jgi:oxygen-independent coproporphyrinogen-3 oxidase
MNSPGLYIHVPFCQKKCPYCDFYSSADLGLVDAWLKAVSQEIALYREVFPAFDSLYLGGGTPSLLTEKQIGKLLECLRREVNFLPDGEITLEANPDDLTLGKLLFYKDIRINRLSLGVQSFDDAELKFLGRRHTAAQSRQALSLARAAGFDNLSLDLMYGLPGQGLGTWESSLAAALSYNPGHLSCYQLTLEPGTELARRQGEGCKSLVNEDLERDLFLFTSTCLPEHGYLHYEISNFALGEEHLCRHNLKYWRRLPYLGLGPAAHSFDGVMRWWNHRSVARYCETLAAGAAPVAGSEVLTPEQVRLEKLWLGFRTREGVELSAVKGDNQAEEVLAALQRDGLLRVENGWAVPTLMGFLLADRLPLMLDN